MVIIERIENAPEWLQKAVRSTRDGHNARVVGFVRNYARYHRNNLSERMRVTFRDRGPEMIAMIQGLLRDLEAPVHVNTRKGSDLYREFEFPAVGAQFATDYDIFYG